MVDRSPSSSTQASKNMLFDVLKGYYSETGIEEQLGERRHNGVISRAESVCLP
jgi:hypothetical protein